MIEQPPAPVLPHSPPAERASDLEKLRFYRDEVRHEFALLGMRSTMLVTCQSFLIVPFAILHTAADFRLVSVPLLMIAALGLFVAIVLRAPLNAAHQTIDQWIDLQRRLFASSGRELDGLALPRDATPVRGDRIHASSLAFSKAAPWAFLTFWLVAIGWVLFRVQSG
jgi:hypothetical protein